MKPIPHPLLLSSIPLLLFFGCSPSDEKVNKEVGENEIPGLEDKVELKTDTLFNEENLSTSYSDIHVFIGEVYQKKGTYFVDIKVETENYHIDILGNLSDLNGNVKGSRVDSFYGHTVLSIPMVLQKLKVTNPIYCCFPFIIPLIATGTI